MKYSFHKKQCYIQNQRPGNYGPQFKSCMPLAFVNGASSEPSHCTLCMLSDSLEGQSGTAETETVWPQI